MANGNTSSGGGSTSSGSPTASTIQQPPAPSTAAPQPPWQQYQMLKGALVLIDSSSSPATKVSVPFQYNPNTLTRTLTPRYYQQRKDAFTGPAAQTIGLTAQLESVIGMTDSLGILPLVAALELMINPTSAGLQAYATAINSNQLKAVPPFAPRLVFVWGPNRLLPVRLTSITVTETLFSNNLVPLVADVALNMELTPFEEATSTDFNYLLTNLQNLESWSQQVDSTPDIGVPVASIS